MKKAALSLSLALVLMLLPILSWAQSGDLLNGKWELNLEKSKFTNTAAPKSDTRTYEVTGQQEKMTATRIQADGQTLNLQFTANRDGKDYPYTGSPRIDTIAITPVDALTSNYTHTQKGKPAGGGTRVISKDGKTMTLSFKATDPKGQPVEALFVFDKR